MKMCAFSYIFIFFLTFPLCFSPGLPFSLPSFLTYHSLSLLLSTPPLLSPSLYYFFTFPLLHLPFFYLHPSTFLPSFPFSFIYFSSSILLHILLLLTPSFLPSCPLICTISYSPFIPFPPSISISLHPFLISLPSISYPPPFLCNLFLSSLSPFLILFLSFFSQYFYFRLG